MNPLSDAAHALRDPALKRDYNRRLFHEVAPRYDLVTRVLSFGRDRHWKNILIRHLPASGVHRALDLACGTGDITRALRDRYPEAEITGIDLCPEMLERARALAPGGIQFVEGDMTDTGLDAASLDLVTGGYALRNAPDLEAALAETRRLLRDGGTAAFLDFSAPANPLLRKLEYGALWFWGALWGLLLHGNPRVYAYIARSLARFPDRASFHRRLADHGLTPLHTQRFMLGMIELVVCKRGKP